MSHVGTCRMRELEEEIQNVHELVHAHRLSVAIAIRAHKAITVHIKKPKIFKEMSHAKGNLTFSR